MNSVFLKDLVLAPTTHINPSTWDEGKYYPFVDELCRHNKEYQKEAIFAALRFLMGGQYIDLRDLARKNFQSNEKIRGFYGSWETMESKLQFPDILSCSLDLATGTGKSYVMYALATIMLAEGKIDRVLVLCPSLTIEQGLTDKFQKLAATRDLRELLPPDSVIDAPKIIDASETVEDGCICVENYHAILKHANSSIDDSFTAHGSRTLVLNDEAHHVASVSVDQKKKWHEFLLNPKYGFRHVVGVSGTCYVGNDYFADVIYRYSLRDAINQGVVKNIEYLTAGPSTNDPDEKWQLRYQNHQKKTSQLGHSDIRPLSIIVTKNITGCETIAGELRRYLQKEERITSEEADKKVLIVTSSPDHRRNISILKNVDSIESKVEWIVSVSMLSEGWDVKNIFHIVPHEERAFNSKLLIAQVLGRGLRIPETWHGSQPVVTVFNHESWSANIQHLVNEILDAENRVSSIVIPDSECHFTLHNLNYEREPETKKIYPQKGEFNLFEVGYVALPTLTDEEIAVIEYERVRGAGRQATAVIRHKTFTIDQIVEEMWGKLNAHDIETADRKERTVYTQKFNRDVLRNVVSLSLEHAGINENKIPDLIRQKLLGALNIIKRENSTRISYRVVPKKLELLETNEMRRNGCSSADLLNGGKTLFCRSDWMINLPKDEMNFYQELSDPDGDYSGKIKVMTNDYHFKSPTNMAIADHNPERRFMTSLITQENAAKISGWIKNANSGFYGVEYSYGTGNRPGRTSHTKRGSFNPDFFINIKDQNLILAVEIKGDEEIDSPSRENIGKHRDASKHFRILNEWLKKQGTTVHYRFNMLTPRDYGVFFENLTQKNYVSQIDATIQNIADDRD